MHNINTLSHDANTNDDVFCIVYCHFNNAHPFRHKRNFSRNKQVSDARKIENELGGHVTPAGME